MFKCLIRLIFVTFLSHSTLASIVDYEIDINVLKNSLLTLSNEVLNIESLGEKFEEGEILEEDIEQLLRRLSIMQDQYNAYLKKSTLSAYPALIAYDLSGDQTYVDEMSRVKTEIGLLSFLLMEEYISFLDLIYKKNQGIFNIGQDALYETVYYDKIVTASAPSEVDKVKGKVYDAFMGIGQLATNPVFGEIFEYEDSYNVLKVTLSVLRPQIRQNQLLKFGIKSNGHYIEDAKNILATFIESFEMNKNCQNIFH